MSGVKRIKRKNPLFSHPNQLEIYDKLYRAFESLAFPGDDVFYVSPQYASEMACKKFVQVMGLTDPSVIEDWRFAFPVRVLEGGALANSTEEVSVWTLRLGAFYSWLGSRELRMEQLTELLYPLWGGPQEEEGTYENCVEYLKGLGERLGTFRFNELLVQWAFSLGGSEKQVLHSGTRWQGVGWVGGKGARHLLLNGKSPPPAGYFIDLTLTQREKYINPPLSQDFFFMV